MPPELYDTIVVGAGMSGLWAGFALSSVGLKVLVLESRDRVGGRTHTIKSKVTGEAIDRAWIHGIEGNPLYELADRLQVKLSHRDYAAPRFYNKSGELSQELASKLALNLFSSFFDGARTYAQQHTTPSYSESLQDFLFSEKSTLFDGLKNEEEIGYAKRFVKSLSGWPGADADQVSLRFWGFERETEGPDVVVQDGYSSILSWVHSQVEKTGGKILLAHKVTEIEDIEESETIKVSTDSVSFEAKTCLCTLPLGVLKHARPKFIPSLPPRRQKSIERLGFGLLNRATVTYPHVWWSHEDMPWIFILPEEDDCRDFPAIGSAIINCQSYTKMNGTATLMFYFGGSLGYDIEHNKDAVVEEWLKSILRKYLPPKDTNSEIPKPSDIIITQWAADPHSFGSYTYIPTSGADPAEAASPLDLIELSKPLYAGRLGFAGEHTAVDHYATVHGAMMTGHAEAMRIGAKLDKRMPELKQLFP